ncbi:hypothetical protein PHLGIDRAFT_463675 [Phlebiopsis gigantea 11061_1 CR5-6]|uniref:Uncharacterized protein n=1 Tax=Phlebiopsis gigantea (strain 11061_1 CR5-6) TaxID=745531 RepID=A0A0C3S6R7_PHLG1|nr:hypothetical protein PHLGIDRAFT_463675 [Phlebiopsis gigantea 11061_1 CR5-6]
MRPPLGLATPSYTPIVEKTNLPQVSDGNIRHASLQALLDARRVELDAMNDTHEKLIAEHVALQKVVASHEARISSLCSEMKEKVDLSVTQQQDLSTTRALLSETRINVASITESLRNTSTALMEARQTMDKKEASIQAMTAEKCAQAAKLAEAERALAALESKYAAERRQLVTARDDLEKKLALAYQNEILLQDGLRIVQEQLSSRDVTNQALLDRGREAEHQLDALRSATRGYEEKLGAAQSTIDALAGERDDLVRRYDALSGEFDATHVTITTLEQELQGSRRAVAEDHASVTVLTHQVADAHVRISSLDAQLMEQISRNGTLVEDQETAVAVVAELKLKLANVDEAIQLEAAEVHQKTIAISALEAELQRAEKHGADLSSQIEQLATAKAQLQLEVTKLAEIGLSKDTELLEARRTLGVEEGRRRALESDVVALTSKSTELASKASVTTREVEQLQSQLRHAQARERDLQGRLDALYKEKDGADREAAARRTSLQESLTVIQHQASSLESRLVTTTRANTDLISRLEAKTKEIAESSVALRSAEDRVGQLDAQASSLRAANEGLAQRVAQWRIAKEEDDGTIQKLQQLLAHHETFFKSQLAALCQANALLPAPAPV